MSARESSNEEKKVPYPCDADTIRKAGSWHFGVRRLLQFDQSLTPTEDHFMRVLLDDMDFDNWDVPSYRSIPAYRAQMKMKDDRTVSRVIKSLTKKGWIDAEARDQQSYLIRPRAEKFAEMSHVGAQFTEAIKQVRAQRNAGSHGGNATRTSRKKCTTPGAKNAPPLPEKMHQGGAKNAPGGGAKNAPYQSNPKSESSSESFSELENGVRDSRLDLRDDGQEVNSASAVMTKPSPSTDGEAPSVKREDRPQSQSFGAGAKNAPRVPTVKRPACSHDGTRLVSGADREDLGLSAYGDVRWCCDCGEFIDELNRVIRAKVVA